MPESSKRQYPENRRKPVRSIGVSDDLWTRFKATAAGRGETATKALIRFMEWYVGDRKKP